MLIPERSFTSGDFTYTIRNAKGTDAKALSELRLRIDGETENLDREPGEAYMDEAVFQVRIREDAEQPRSLFLVVEAGGSLVGFCRCQGSALKRFSHRVEFGICILKAYWGYGIGKALLAQSVAWADANGIKKMMLSVLETNTKAIALYERLGFMVEGTLKKDRLLSDGNYYDTIIMGRVQD